MGPQIWNEKYLWNSQIKLRFSRTIFETSRWDKYFKKSTIWKTLRTLIFHNNNAAKNIYGTEKSNCVINKQTKYFILFLINLSIFLITFECVQNFFKIFQNIFFRKKFKAITEKLLIRSFGKFSSTMWNLVEKIFKVWNVSFIFENL